MRAYTCDRCEVTGMTMHRQRRCWRCGRFARRVAYRSAMGWAITIGLAQTQYTTRYFRFETRGVDGEGIMGTL